MFNLCSNLENLNLNSFETSNLILLNRMFYKYGKIISLDLNSFYTPKIEGMS